MKIKLNCWIISWWEYFCFAGKDLPFSAFERSQSKAKFGGMSSKHGCQSSFITLSPPEQDNMCLLKLYLIRNTKDYNGKI